MGQLTGDAKKDMSLIGQFGVGFYSSFMVADKVEVLSRKAGDREGWRWTSDGQGSFTVEPAANVPRGARITLHMREGDDEYLDPFRLRQIVTRYSDHIALPIVLADGNKEETINRASALWTRPCSEITEEQYKEFYHHVGHGFDDPWLTIYARAEGVLNIRAVVRAVAEAVRPVRPGAQVAAQALCAARVHHRRGDRSAAGVAQVHARVVDSEDLPLNISREMLQSNPTLARSASSSHACVVRLGEEGDRRAGRIRGFLGQFRRGAQRGLV